MKTNGFGNPSEWMPSDYRTMASTPASTNLAGDDAVSFAQLFTSAQQQRPGSTPMDPSPERNTEPQSSTQSDPIPAGTPPKYEIPVLAAQTPESADAMAPCPAELSNSAFTESTLVEAKPQAAAINSGCQLKNPQSQARTSHASFVRKDFPDHCLSGMIVKIPALTPEGLPAAQISSEPTDSSIPILDAQDHLVVAASGNGIPPPENSIHPSADPGNPTSRIPSAGFVSPQNRDSSQEQSRPHHLGLTSPLTLQAESAGHRPPPALQGMLVESVAIVTQGETISQGNTRFDLQPANANVPLPSDSERPPRIKPSEQHSAKQANASEMPVESKSPAPQRESIIPSKDHLTPQPANEKVQSPSDGQRSPGVDPKEQRLVTTGNALQTPVESKSPAPQGESIARTNERFVPQTVDENSQLPAMNPGLSRSKPQEQPARQEVNRPVIQDDLTRMGSSEQPSRTPAPTTLAEAFANGNHYRVPASAHFSASKAAPSSSDHDPSSPAEAFEFESEPRTTTERSSGEIQKFPVEGVKKDVSPKIAAGTDDAKPWKQMNSAVQQNEFASSGQQKLPGLDLVDTRTPISVPWEEKGASRIRHEAAVAGALHELSSRVAATVNEPVFAKLPSVVTEPTRATDLVQRLISDQAIEMKQTGAMALMVTVKPDGKADLVLHLEMRDGSIQVRVQCGQEMAEKLAPAWDQLQQSLAGQGIHVAALNEAKSPDNQEGQRSWGQMADQSQEQPAPDTRRERSSSREETPERSSASPALRSRSMKTKQMPGRWETWA